MRKGIKGYLSKDVQPKELRDALISVSQKGYYYTDYVTGKIVATFSPEDRVLIDLTDREIEFLKLCCTDLSY